MGAADRVEPGVLQQLDASFLRTADGRGAEDPVVVMDARTAEFDGLAVDPEPVLGIEPELTDPEAAGDLILDLGSLDDRSSSQVERRCFDIPQRRLGNVDPLPNDDALAGPDRGGRAAFCYLGAVRTVDASDDGDGSGVETVVAHRDPRSHDCALLVDVGGGDLEPAVLDVGEAGDDQAGVSVDAGAGVPPGIVVRSRIDPDRVGCSVAEVRVEGDRESGIAVRALAGEHAVDEDHRVTINAFEFDRDLLVREVGWNVEGLRVLEDTTGKIGVSPSRGRVLGAGKRDHRIVGERDRDAVCLGCLELGVGADFGPDGPAGVEGGRGHDSALFGPDGEGDYRSIERRFSEVARRPGRSSA